MQADSQTVPVSQAMLWTGRVVSALPALALLASGGMKLMNSPEVKNGFEHLGWEVGLALALGITELVCTIIYIIPPTAVLGAILLTGYLGGAIATHVRIGEAFYGPVILGVLIWGGLWLRDARLRALLPWRRS